MICKSIAMFLRPFLVVVVSIVGIIISSIVEAEVKLPALISDNMVLQREMEVPIWGVAEPGEEVTVSIATQKLRTTANEEGRWMVTLAPMEAGGPFEMTVAASNTITVHNVLIGDVWVCAGQSNMELLLTNSANAEAEIPKAQYQNIRLYRVNVIVGTEPLEDPIFSSNPGTPVYGGQTGGYWRECNPATAAVFSAAGYYFGRDIHKSLNVPVGLIWAAWGGTPAETWVSKQALESDPELKPMVDWWAKVLADWPEEREKYDKRVAEWNEACGGIDFSVAPPGGIGVSIPEPFSPKHYWYQQQTAGLFNGMIAPLSAYPIKGVIWYQGESNIGRAKQYRKLFQTLIRDWRRVWGQGDFPFLFVQLPNYYAVNPEPGNSLWAELREAQLMALALPNTGMAVTIDVGEAWNLHPLNKQDVGHRLALAAQALVYGKDVVYSGPIYDSMEIEGNTIRLHFKHVESGLVSKDNQALTGFAVAGEDKKFVWADARIEGDTIIVSSESVPEPVAVRYAWADNPVCNLYNAEGLPASPFRTDRW